MQAEAQVRAMTAAMRHRGPDEQGFLFNEPRAPGLALGVRRLSIIDLAGGHQPIWNESQDVAVVFNGELYGYRELRERLILCGHRFRTQSDTEILVHAWEEWGEDALSELRGMFAFALLDLRRRYATAPILFLARDPLGIKPLYYAQTPDGFAFASEMRALLVAGAARKNVSRDALTSYLLFGSRQEVASDTRRGGRGAFDRGCPGGLVPFKRAGLRSHRRARGESTVRDSELYADISRHGI